VKILHVVAARPNFMKVAPIVRAVAARPDRYRQVLVHTGQHYDAAMSKIFFDDIGLPRPDFELHVGSGTHAEQTARTMLAFEPVLREAAPDLVLVVGDVNATVACALVATKLGIRLGHVEAGLRSQDRSMPEEINRVLTDAVADLLFTTERDAEENLKREGIDRAKIFFVGNVMIDSLLRHRAAALALRMPRRFGLEGEPYVLVTLHRPSNVDDPALLAEILRALVRIQERTPVLFPIHPRTRHRIQEFRLQGSLESAPRLRLLEPLGYLEFLGLMASARLVLTDSGGVQEETTILGIPCLTARPNTERPVTITEGTNELVESTAADLVAAATRRLEDRTEIGRQPELWDGHAAERIVRVLDTL
jgi:UDP-N-acetylglucosamine 2-epimerase (non-hydrolysing)